MRPSETSRGDDAPGVRRRWRPRRYPHLPPLSPTARILLLILGWFLIVLGLVGLVLPGLQGVVTLALGAAALSLVSQTILDSLRFLLRPWPWAWRLVLRTRRRVHYWIRRRRKDDSDQRPGDVNSTGRRKARAGR